MPAHRGGRVEANALPWDELTGQQRAAVQRVSQFILAAIDSVDTRPAEGMTSVRTSQIVFVDGDRGTGKTSVLLTIAQLLARRRAADPRVDGNAKSLREVRDRVVWLETLDLEPLKGNNMFAALLVRLGRLLEIEDGKEIPLAHYLADGDGPAATLAALVALQNDAVLMWDARRPSSEPDAHVHAILRAERAGLEINERTRKVLDKIARALPAGRATNPVFVVPVDDFDLAPTLCFEVLQLARILAIDRLVFVVAGNTRIAEAMLRLGSEGALRRVGGDAADVAHLAMEISSNNMRKLVPPAQRVPLLRLPVSAALDLAAGSLRHHLEATFIESNQAPTGRATLSLLRWLGLEEGRTASGGWRVAEWLSGTPRQVLDRGELFADHPGNPGDWGEKLLADVLHACGQEVREDWTLPVEFRETIARALDVGARLRLDLQGAGISAVVERLPMQVVRRDGVRLEFDRPELTFQLHEHRLDERTTTTIVFAHDLAVSLWGAYFPTGSLAASCAPGPGAGAVWEGDRQKELWVAWPIPDWWSFRDFERFNHHWELHRASCEGDFGSAWLAALLEVVSDSPPQPNAGGRSAAHLGKLFADVVRETPPRRAARRVLRSSVLSCVLRLVAPESASGIAGAMLQHAGASALLDDLETIERVRFARAATWADLATLEVWTTATWRLAWGLSVALAEARLADLARQAFASRGRHVDENASAELVPIPKTDPIWSTLAGREYALAREAFAGRTEENVLRDLYQYSFDPNPEDVARVRHRRHNG